MDKLLKLTKDKTQDLNSHMTSKEFELVIKTLLPQNPRTR